MKNKLFNLDLNWFRIQAWLKAIPQFRCTYYCQRWAINKVCKSIRKSLEKIGSSNRKSAKFHSCRKSANLTHYSCPQICGFADLPFAEGYLRTAHLWLLWSMSTTLWGAFHWRQLYQIMYSLKRIGCGWGRVEQTLGKSNAPLLVCDGPKNVHFCVSKAYFYTLKDCLMR